MKQIPLIILIMAIGLLGWQGDGILARFSDIECSIDNKMCSGFMALQVNGNSQPGVEGEPLTVEHAMPCKYYYQDWLLTNLGTRSGTVYVMVQNVACVEDAPGAGTASSEPELTAEEGGQVGDQIVTGLGVDLANLCDHVDMSIWYDLNGDGDVDDTGELIVDAVKISQLADVLIELGELPVPEAGTMEQGGGWGQYFAYTIDENGAIMTCPLIAGQGVDAGAVNLSNDSENLCATYDTGTLGCDLCETHFYVGKNPPPKMAPGKFPCACDPVPPGQTCHTHTIPLDEICDYQLVRGHMEPVPGTEGVVPGDTVYIAAHCVVDIDGDEETAWARADGGRLFRIAVHMQQVEDPNWTSDDSQKWWPTNAYQGETCFFDLFFELDQTSFSRHWTWNPEDGLTYDVVDRGDP
jgi:hypothetical protein